MVKLLILGLEVEDLIGHIRQVAFFCLGYFVAWHRGCLSYDGMLKTIGAIMAVAALIASLIDDRQYLFCWKLTVFIDTHSCRVDIRNRTVFHLFLVLAMVQAAIALLGFDQSLQGLDVGKFLQEQLCFCALLTFLLPCPGLLKLLCSLMLQSFLLGPEQRSEPMQSNSI